MEFTQNSNLTWASIHIVLCQCLGWQFLLINVSAIDLEGVYSEKLLYYITATFALLIRKTGKSEHYIT